MCSLHMSRTILAILLCINIAVTSILLAKVSSLTTQVHDARQAFNSAIDTVSAIKTVVSGNLIDKAYLLKQGVDQIKNSDIADNLKDKWSTYIWRK